VTQTVECLFCKCKALRPNSSLIKKKKKKKKKDSLKIQSISAEKSFSILEAVKIMVAYGSFPQHSTLLFFKDSGSPPLLSKLTSKSLTQVILMPQTPQVARTTGVCHCAKLKFLIFYLKAYILSLATNTVSFFFL
jgi:hypothetical protein